MDLTKILSGIFPGNKTYLAAAGLVVMAYLHYRGGDLLGAGTLLSQALAAAGLRVALAAGPVAPTSPPAAPTVSPVSPVSPTTNP